MKKWVSEKHKSWRMPEEGFKGHVATDGSLQGTAGKWGAYGWSEVQLDYDEELGPLHGMYGSMEAELEVQRTTKRAELTAFFFASLKKGLGPSKCKSITKASLTGYGGERKCIHPKAADLWIKIWEELHNIAAGDILVELKHVKAHRTKKEKHRCRTLRSSSLKATRRRMSGQKKEQCWKKGSWRKQEQRQCSRSEKRCMQRCSVQPAFTAQWKNGRTVMSSIKLKPKEKWTFVDQKREETKHRTEWCAEASKYRCMRCGRGSKCMKMPGKCTVPKYLSKKLGK